MSDPKSKNKCKVPPLRFPEFCGEWNVSALSEIAVLIKGMGISKKQKSETGNPCILYGELYTTYRSEVIKEIFSRTNIESSNLIHSKANDVIIPSSGETAIDISTARCVPYDNILLGGDLNIIRLSKQDGKFFSYQLNGVRKNEIAKIAQGVSVVHLYGENLKKMKVSYPQLEEQEKIARFLTLIDQRISIQSKIIEDLKKLKSAISRKVFAVTPIHYSRLDTYYTNGKAGGTPLSSNRAYYNGDIPFLSINDITRQGKYICVTENYLSELGLSNSSAWLVPSYSLIMSMYASVGLVTINKLPITTSQAMFSMVLKDPDQLEYLYYYLSYFKYRYIYRYLETGTQSNINADIVKSIMIPHYGKKNTVIAKSLKSIDDKIETEKKILKHLIKQKAYFLSHMFI